MSYHNTSEGFDTQQANQSHTRPFLKSQAEYSKTLNIPERMLLLVEG